MNLCRSLCVVWCLVASLAQGEVWDLYDGSRAFVGNRLQERRMTPTNWPDLPAEPTIERSVPTTRPPAAKAATPPQGYRVFLDAGHGGKDSGAHGLWGTVEKDITLQIARMVREQLRTTRHRLPIDVYLSRETDMYLSLRDRVTGANSVKADLFVSIHANASPTPKAHGFEVYFLSAEASDEHARRIARAENGAEATPVGSQIQSILSDVRTTFHVKESSEMASYLFRSISESLPPNGRGVRQAPFTVLSGTEMPAVLVEVGYVTHPYEAKSLRNLSYLKRIASSISAGVVEYLRSELKS